MAGLLTNETVTPLVRRAGLVAVNCRSLFGPAEVDSALGRDAQDVVQRRGQRQLRIEIAAHDWVEAPIGLLDAQVAGRGAAADFADRQMAAARRLERNIEPGRA